MSSGINSTIGQELEKQGQAFFQTVGDSMEPLLHNRKSTVVINKTTKELKKYDVALYRRPTGQYVLHRVVKIRKKDYLICGDNRIYKEAVPKEWVLGVMMGYYPDESKVFVSCGDERYQKYLKAWAKRHRVRWFKALPGRIQRKLRFMSND